MTGDPFNIEKHKIPTGARVAPKYRGGKRKAKPPIGPGQYVKAPLLRDKLTNPRWVANAVVNNPGNTAAGAGIAAGSATMFGQKKKPIAKRDKKDTAAGAAIGAGAGHFARVGADYGSKTVAERQFKPLTTKGNYGPYTEGPHKPILNKYKRTPKGNVRQKAKMFDENFPKGLPSHNARKVGVVLNRKGAVAGAALGGAALGGAASRKVRKNMTFSEFAKAEKEKEKNGAKIAGAGAAVSGVGFLAGGNPKNKRVSLDGINFTEKPKTARQMVGDKVRVARRMTSGGVLGFRSTVHEGGLYGFNQQKTKDEWSGPPKDTKTAFKHGRNAGKIAPEVKVLRHMAGGRKAANAAWVGGAGAAAYGAAKHRKETVKKARTKSQNDALEGAGKAGLGVTAGGSALLSSQKRAWKKTASNHIDEAGKLAPNTAGRRKGRFGRVGMDPSVTDGAIIRNPGLLKGTTIDTARKVGEHRGAAAQARHFSHVYGNAGKGTAIIGGALSATALAASKSKPKQKVKKSMSPFGVDHG